MPVSETVPPVVASPKAWVSWSKSAHFAPPAASARSRAASTWMPVIAERSIMKPPSQVPLPAKLWPPPLTDTSRSCSRANSTQAWTSAVPAQRPMSAGVRSIMPFQTRRATS